MRSYKLGSRCPPGQQYFPTPCGGPVQPQCPPPRPVLPPSPHHGSPVQPRGPKGQEVGVFCHWDLSPWRWAAVAACPAWPLTASGVSPKEWCILEPGTVLPLEDI